MKKKKVGKLHIKPYNLEVYNIKPYSFKSNKLNLNLKKKKKATN
jgi:hypothetical protein